MEIDRHDGRRVLFGALLMLWGCEPTRPGGPSSNGGTTGVGGDSSPGTGGSDPVGDGGSGGTTSSGASGGASSSGAGGDGGGRTGTGAAGGAGDTAGTGGAVGAAGTAGTTGTTGTGGVASTAGTTGRGGTTGLGGSTGTGGTSSSGGTRPCDIYQSAGTPCVAAHSTVRALYGTYSGPLYQVKRASDKTTKDVLVDGPGGFVNVSVQNSFCSGTTCTISDRLRPVGQPQRSDQIAVGRDLVADGGNEANAADGTITVGGHTGHGIYVNNPTANVGYRNNAAKGLATGDQPEAMYMVLDGKRSSTICCFDYGNVGKSGTDEGNATMEAIYWGRLHTVDAGRRQRPVGRR